MKVGVVSGFIPLPVRHLTERQYRDYWMQLLRAIGGIPHYAGGGRLDDCWAYDLCTGLPPANPPPADRYATQEINVMSHIVQHQRTTWALEAAQLFPAVNVWVWLDYGIMKQGAWRHNQITPESVQKFIQRVVDTPPPMDYIPFPGVHPKTTVYPTGNMWRFCGSAHIWPRHFLENIDRAYKHELRTWVGRHQTVPLDLPIWALVEQNSRLPFRWYPAEYDASQLDNYPGSCPLPE